jgi:HD-GYP domain-containing protein (c-di-GMP phosphodiesterase class II)
VKVLTYLKRLDNTILRSMIVAFCHHLNMDRSGYPQTQRTIRPDAISRIVRIADIYDALTSARSYRMKPFSSSEALGVIAEKAGKELDPVLCSIFAEVVGVLPQKLEEAREKEGAAATPMPAEVE